MWRERRGAARRGSQARIVVRHRKAVPVVEENVGCGAGANASSFSLGLGSKAQRGPGAYADKGRGFGRRENLAHRSWIKLG